MSKKVREKSRADLLSRPVDATGKLRRKCACGSHTTGGNVCEACKEKNKSLERAATSAETMSAVPPIVNEVVNSPGQRLSDNTRTDMGRHFGTDFSQVRVHTDARAAESAEMVNAQAYTIGRDVVFAAGQFSEHTSGGQKLLAHELAHVAQPNEGASTGISSPDDPGEREADRAAEKVVRGETVEVGSASGAVLHRQAAPEFDLAQKFGDKILEEASPFLAAALGSETLDNYETGKSELKPDHITKLTTLAHRIEVLMRKYNMSTITIIGHADTVGTEKNNEMLGEQRAEVVKKKLTDLGIAESIMTIESKGEKGPQAEKTKDETPSAANRRVEIRFHPKSLNLSGTLTGKLKPPSVGKGLPPDEYSKPEPPPIDFRYRPRIEPHDPTKLPPDFWKPIPPIPKGAEPKSLMDIIGEKVVDPIVDSVLGGASQEVRDKAKEIARAGIEKGITSGARAFAEAQGVTDPATLDAIEKAIEAGIKEKGKQGK